MNASASRIDIANHSQTGDLLRYPKDHEKDVLASRSGLTRNQVQASLCLQRIELDQIHFKLMDLSDFALAGVELVHKRPRPSVEADDRGDVPGPEEELGCWRAGGGNGAPHEQASNLRGRRRQVNSLILHQELF
jgi:hypothetical protein